MTTLAYRKSVLAGLLVACFAPFGWGQTTTVRNFLVASGYICDLVANECPATEKAADGGTVEINGVGNFTTPANTIAATGAYTTRDSSGVKLDDGLWTATSLVSYKSYGVDQNTPPREGGLAQMNIQLFSDFGGAPINAVLYVNCSDGNPPKGFTKDFIKLNITGGESYSTYVRAVTVYTPLPATIP